jgi:succinyl-diaminopimelate desuccinylase
MTQGPADKLLKIIEVRREEMVELARALIRFPTINPPGDAYQPCT